VTYELVRGNPGNPLNPEGKGSMFQNRVMPEGKNLFQKAPHVTTGYAFAQITDADGRITEPRSQCDCLFRIGCMLDKRNQHGNLSEKKPGGLVK